MGKLLNKETWAQIYPQILFFVVAAVLFIFIAFLLGVVPGHSLPSMVNSLWVGEPDNNIKNQIYVQYSDMTFFPYGFAQNEGFFVSIIKGIFMLAGVSPLDSLLASFFLIYSIGFAAMLYVLLKLSKSMVITLLLTGLFYISPFVLNQGAIIPMYMGILILPLSFMCDYIVLREIIAKKKLFWHEKEKSILRKNLFLVGFSFFVKVIVVSIGWYTGFMCASCSLAFFIIIIILDIKAEKYGTMRTKTLNFVIFVLAPWILALAWIALIMPAGTAEFDYAGDVFYGSSVDISTLFLPNESQLMSQVIPSFNTYIPEGYSLTGDYQFWSNYMGYAMVIMATILAIKNKSERKIVWTLFLIAILTLALSLGPAPKVFQLVENENGSVYSLNLEGSSWFFPWKWIYDIFPIKLMRTTYRWFLMFQCSMILLLAFLMGKVFQNKRKIYRMIVVGICAICIVEFLPANIPDIIQEKQENYVQAKAQFQNVHNDLAGMIEENSVVAIGLGGKGNIKYLSSVMISGFDSHIYSGSGDKSYALSTAYTPFDIRKLEGEEDPRTIAHCITVIDERNLADYVVLPYYDMFKDIYSWPPSEQEINEQKKIADEVQAYLKGRYEVFYTDYYTVFKLNKSAAGSFYNMTSDRTLSFEKAKEPYLGDKVYRISGQTPLIFKLDIDKEQQYDRLYSQFYMEPGGQESDISIMMTIKLIDEEGNISREINKPFELQQGEDFSKYIKIETNEILDLDNRAKQIEVSLNSAQDVLLKIFNTQLYSSAKILPLHYEGQIFNYMPNDLSTVGNAVKNENEIEVYEEGTQFGPYVELPPGRYKISIYGKNLNKGKFSIYSVAGDQNIEIKVVKNYKESSSTKNVYEFEITPEDISKQAVLPSMNEYLVGIEFVHSVSCATNQPLELNRIQVQLMESY